MAATVTAAGALVVQKHNPVDATAGPLTMTLPTGAPEGSQLSVEKTDASTNLVTVTGSIRGSAGSLTLAFQRETIQLRANADGSWFPVAGHRTKVSLDAAYLPGRAVASIRRRAPRALTSPTTSTPSMGYLLGLLPDGVNKVFGNTSFADSQIGRSTDGAAFTWGKNFQGGSGIADAFVMTPGGEALVACHDRSTSTGTLYRSTGFNPATMDATSWATVLAGSKPGAFFDGRWCLTERSVAPLASPASGRLWICEYNGNKVWRSTDDGATWAVIFDLQTVLPGATHMHAVAYDRWDDRVWVSVGDTQYAAIYYADREAINGTATAWTLLPGSDTATRQSTTIVPMPAAMVFLSDANGSAIFAAPRRTARTYASLRVAVSVPGAALIGAHAFQAADDLPVYLTFYSSASGQTPRGCPDRCARLSGRRRPPRLPDLLQLGQRPDAPGVRHRRR